MCIEGGKQKLPLDKLEELWLLVVDFHTSLHRGHANFLCIIPILA